MTVKQQQQDFSEKQKPLEKEESVKQPTTSTESTDMVTPYVSHITALMEQLLALKLKLNQKTSTYEGGSTDTTIWSTPISYKRQANCHH